MTAPDQTDLFGSDEPAPRADAGRQSLFFALIPPPAVAGQVVALTQMLRERHGLKGRPLLPQHLHVTLVCAADLAGGVPAEYIQAAQAAAASMRHPPLDVMFDRALSFPGGAFVLSGDGSAAVHAYAKLLRETLKRFGLKPPAASTPHMTLLYDRRLAVEEHPVEPIRWTAASFSLVLSHVGRTQHDPLGAWPLRA